MRRRTFIAAAPLAAAGLAVKAGAQSSGSAAPLPTFQPAGAESFARPDVHAGDRPLGATFASRSAVYGRSRNNSSR